MLNSFHLELANGISYNGRHYPKGSLEITPHGVTARLAEATTRGLDLHTQRVASIAVSSPKFRYCRESPVAYVRLDEDVLVLIDDYDLHHLFLGQDTDIENIEHALASVGVPQGRLT